MNHDFIQKLTLIVQENLENENFGPDQLAQKMGVSHSTLHRKLKAVNGQTISQFIREIRLKKAKYLLTKEDSTISEIAYKVGFGSPSYFNNCFHEYFNITPGELKKRKELESGNKILPNKRKLIYYSFFTLLGLTIITIVVLKLFVVSEDSQLNKSISILPIEYSGKPEFQYQAEGMREEIKNNLHKIKDIQVLDTSPLEDYKVENGKENKQNFGFFLKTTFQKEGNTTVLFVSLINSDNGAVHFSKRYTFSQEGLFELRSEIAKTIAKELNADISQEENARIDIIPTKNLTAFDLYQQATYTIESAKQKGNLELVNKAYNQLLKAIELDDSFAPAYASLAEIYSNAFYPRRNKSESCLDSALLFADQALLLDKSNAEAYYVKGNIYLKRNKRTKAIKEFNKAIEVDPNYYQGYLALGYLNMYYDPVKAFQNHFKAMQLHRGKDLPNLLFSAGGYCFGAGFKDYALQYYKDAFEIMQDSIGHLFMIGVTEAAYGEFEKAETTLLKAYQADTSRANILKELGMVSCNLKKYQNSIIYLEKYLKMIEKLNYQDPNTLHYLAFAKQKCGYTEEAKELFYKQIEITNRLLADDENINENNDYNKYVDLVGIYSALGEKDKAIEYLRMLNKMKWYHIWMVTLLQNHQIFDNLRNDPEFIQLSTEIIMKYQRGHDQVKDWLEDNELFKPI